MIALIIIGSIFGTIIGLLLLYVIVLAISAALVDPHKEYEKDSKFYRWLLNTGARLGMIGSRVSYDVKGKERLPEGRYLVVGNHLSNWDPILSWYIVRPTNLAFVSKEGNFHIPLYGRIIRRCCFKIIDRQDPKESIKTLHRAAEMIKNDECCFGIYPEGTRNRTPENGLLPFHNGVFRIAQQAKVPIVVIASVGAEKFKKNYPWHRTHITMDICDMIPTEELLKMRTQDIGDRVAEDLNIALGYKKAE